MAIKIKKKRGNLKRVSDGFQETDTLKLVLWSPQIRERTGGLVLGGGELPTGALSRRNLFFETSNQWKTLGFEKLVNNS